LKANFTLADKCQLFNPQKNNPLKIHRQIKKLIERKGSGEAGFTIFSADNGLNTVFADRKIIRRTSEKQYKFSAYYLRFSMNFSAFCDGTPFAISTLSLGVADKVA
jgi:hypothetical protein